MSHLPLILSWYAIFGLVWAYLLLHEQYTGRQNKGFKWTGHNVVETIVGCLMLIGMSIVAWPYSLYRHARVGSLKDLFNA